MTNFKVTSAILGTIILGTATSAIASPQLTINNPSGFGAENGQVYVQADYQTKTRNTEVSDGQVGFGIGIGSAKDLALDLNVTANSFGLNSNGGKLGDGNVSVKLHKNIDSSTGIAVGYNSIVSNGLTDYPKNSYYVAATKVVALKKSVDETFSRASFTIGYGGGQFKDSMFGSVAVKVTKSLSTIVEYQAGEMSIEASYSVNENLNVNAAVKDLSTTPRLVSGASFSF
jgi:hypothetical protein